MYNQKKLLYSPIYNEYLINSIIKMDKDTKAKTETDKKTEKKDTKEEKQVRLEVFEEDDYFEEFEDVK